MDFTLIKSKVEEVAKRLQNDEELRQQFASTPERVTATLIGGTVPPDQFKHVVSGVKIKLSLDDADGKFGEILDTISDKVGGVFRK